MEKLQLEVTMLRKKEKEQKIRQKNNQKLKILIPKPPSYQQEYFSYIHNCGSSVILITIGGTIVDANTSFCHEVNRDYSEVIGSSFFSFAHSSTLPSLYSYLFSHGNYL